MLYLKKKDINNAAEAFKNVLKKNSSHVGALIEYATTLSLLGEFEKSKKYFQYALKIEPKNILANLRLGKIYQAKLNDLDAAIHCYEQIIEVDPTYFKAHF